MDASIVALELIRLFQMFNHFPYLIQSAGPSLNSQSVSWCQSVSFDVPVYSVTEIPSVMESEMQQNLQCLLSTASPADSIHDVILQVHAIYQLKF